MLDRKSSYDDVLATLENTFFPDGISATGVKLQTLTFYIAKFNSEALPKVLRDGSIFTFGGYRDLETVSPLRLYLHTNEVK
jgi:hypothetical protein